MAGKAFGVASVPKAPGRDPRHTGLERVTAGASDKINPIPGANGTRFGGGIKLANRYDTMSYRIDELL